MFQLAYMAQYYKEKNNTNDEIIFHSIETRLRKIIEKNAFVDFLEFNFSSPVGNAVGCERRYDLGIIR